MVIDGETIVARRRDARRCRGGARAGCPVVDVGDRQIVPGFGDRHAHPVAFPAGTRATFAAAYDRLRKLTALFEAARVLMLAGRDVGGAAWLVPGPSLHREFDALAGSVCSPLRVLQMATGDAADVVGRSDRLGAVTPGRRADLVLRDGDPLADEQALHRIEGPVRAGRYLSRADLDAVKVRVAADRSVARAANTDPVQVRRSQPAEAGRAGAAAGLCSTPFAGDTTTSSPCNRAVPSTISENPAGSAGGQTRVTSGWAAAFAQDPRPGLRTTSSPATGSGRTETTLARGADPAETVTR
jgi:hypothetical protein